MVECIITLKCRRMTFPKRPRLVEPEIPFLGEPEIQRLVAAAPPDLKPVVLILADTGLRRGELLSLEWRDVDLARGTVLVRKSKTGRGREVPLTARARQAFEEVRAARTGTDGTPPLPEDLAFEGYFALRRKPHTREGHTPGTDRDRLEALLTVRIRRLARAVGLPGVGPHSLRHSFASRMVMAGVPLSFVARVTGHSTLTCAARYGKHAPTDAGKLAIRALEEATGAANGSTVPAPGPTVATCGAVAGTMATDAPVAAGAHT